jgi:hypothetical protein
MVGIFIRRAKLETPANISLEVLSDEVRWGTWAPKDNIKFDLTLIMCIFVSYIEQAWQERAIGFCENVDEI